jgi:hypothetical protein
MCSDINTKLKSKMLASVVKGCLLHGFEKSGAAKM